MVDRVSDDGHVSTAELARELGVSEMTIRRDIADLAERGLVERVIGGARRSANGSAAFEERATQGRGSKSAIARAAGSLLDGGTIALDAGTTVALVAPHVPAGSRVITHSAPVVASATARDDLELIVLGGSYQHATRSFVGLEALAQIDSLVIDTAVVSATGIEGGWLHVHDPLDAAVKRAFIAAAQRVILVADGAKIGVRGSIRLAPLEAVSIAVTDAAGAAALALPEGVELVEAGP